MSKDPRREVRVYVGNLPSDCRTRDIEDIFAKYGRIAYVDLKAGGQRRSAFAFIEFEDTRDAEDAVKYRDGYEVDGHRLRVEFTRGVGPRGPGGRPLYGKDDRRYGDRGDFRRKSPPRPPRRTGYRVVVTGLPNSGSWQDLKDHMREAGDVCYSDVFKDGTGVVEYIRYEDMKYALKKLDDTKFKSHEGETSYIRVKEADEKDDVRFNGRANGGGGGGGRRSRSSRSRSPVRRQRGSPQYSPRGGTRSRSRSRT